MLRIKQLQSFCFVIFLSSAAVQAKHQTIDLTRLVVVGDSLAAGVENIGLLESQQQAGFAAVLAKQVKTNMVLPLAPEPGVPNILEVKKQGLIPEIGPVEGTLPAIPRINYIDQPTNLAVPGFTVGDALNFRPDANAPPGPQQWGNFVLGFPTPFAIPGPSRTMIEQAVMLNPTTTLVWIGNNDALIGALVGIPALITPTSSFEASYKAILDQLSTTNATLITATIPDVTTIPFFTSTEEVASLFGVRADVLSRKVGIGSGDFVRRSALPIIQQILNGEIAGPLPQMCPSPIYALPVSEVPCVFSAKDVATVQARVQAFNDAIVRQSAAHDATLLDTAGLLARLHDKGYKIKNIRLTTSYLGGIFSLDGVHPSETGNAILANFMIDELNHAFKLKIPEASVQDVWNSDRLHRYSTVYDGVSNSGASLQSEDFQSQANGR